MRITVRLFAYLREALGESVELEVPEPVTAFRLMEQFLAAYPQFREAEQSLNLAVDQQYVTEDVPIGPGQEVAIFPPVSGGWGVAGPRGASPALPGLMAAALSPREE
jgi:molybdopterin converting factor subunit 1